VLPCGGFLQRRDPAETRGNSVRPEFCQKRFVETGRPVGTAAMRHFAISIVTEIERHRHIAGLLLCEAERGGCEHLVPVSRDTTLIVSLRLGRGTA
jgi:hypothetical protein